MKKRKLIHLLAICLITLFISCQQEQTEVEIIDDPKTEETIPNPVLVESIPLSFDFVEVLKGSDLVQKYRSQLYSMDLEFSFEAALELIFEGMNEEAQGARHAIIPVIGQEGHGNYLFMYTYNPETKIEGADLVSVLEEEGVRIFTSPDLSTGFDFIAAPTGNGMQAIAFGNAGNYVKCVLEKLVLWGVMNQNAVRFCLSMCSTGGVTNPACLTCIGAALVMVTAAWWAC